MGKKSDHADIDTVNGFIIWFLEYLSDKYGGKITINEVRVIAHVYLNEPTNLTQISKELKLPFSTASDAVARLLYDDWLSQKADPQDGRKRLITISDYARSRKANEWNKSLEVMLSNMK